MPDLIMSANLEQFPIHSEGAGAFILFNNGLVGLQLKDNLEFLPEKWKLATFGGGLEDGETPVQALKRELYEELEIDLDDYEYEYLCTVSVDIAQNGAESTNLISHKFLVKGVEMNKLKPKEGNICIFDPYTDLSYLKFSRFVEPAVEKTIERIKQILPNL
jgi:8-oxo-dGTP pyrophosphatase MutT (NUDIX family)